MDNQINAEPEVILKLIKLTADDRLKWEIAREKSSPSAVGDSYKTIYKDWELTSYKIRLLDQPTKSIMLRYRLSIMNMKTSKTKTLTENQQALKDLYQLVDNKSSRIDDFYENILKE